MADEDAYSKVANFVFHDKNEVDESTANDFSFVTIVWSKLVNSFLYFP